MFLFFYSRFDLGVVAQLGERLNGIHEVRGSIPLSSTNLHQDRRLLSGPAVFVYLVFCRSCFAEGNRSSASNFARFLIAALNKMFRRAGRPNQPEQRLFWLSASLSSTNLHQDRRLLSGPAVFVYLVLCRKL